MAQRRYTAADIAEAPSAATAAPTRRRVTAADIVDSPTTPLKTGDLGVESLGHTRTPASGVPENLLKGVVRRGFVPGLFGDPILAGSTEPYLFPTEEEEQRAQAEQDRAILESKSPLGIFNPKLEGLSPRTIAKAAGARRGLIGFERGLSESMQSVPGLGVMASTRMLGLLPGPAAGVAGTVLSAYFATDMGKAVLAKYPEMRLAYESGDYGRLEELVGEAAVPAAFAGLAGAHALRGVPNVVRGIRTRAANRRAFFKDVIDVEPLSATTERTAAPTTEQLPGAPPPPPPAAPPRAAVPPPPQPPRTPTSEKVSRIEQMAVREKPEWTLEQHSYEVNRLKKVLDKTSLKSEERAILEAQLLEHQTRLRDLQPKPFERRAPEVDFGQYERRVSPESLTTMEAAKAAPIKPSVPIVGPPSAASTIVNDLGLVTKGESKMGLQNFEHPLAPGITSALIEGKDTTPEAALNRLVKTLSATAIDEASPRRPAAIAALRDIFVKHQHPGAESTLRQLVEAERPTGVAEALGPQPTTLRPGEELPRQPGKLIKSALPELSQPTEPAVVPTIRRPAPAVPTDRVPAPIIDAENRVFKIDKELRRIDLTPEARTGYDSERRLLAQRVRDDLVKWYKLLGRNTPAAVENLRATANAPRRLDEIEFLERSVAEHTDIAAEEKALYEFLAEGQERGGQLHGARTASGELIVDEAGKPITPTGPSHAFREAAGKLMGKRRVDVPNVGATPSGAVPEHIADAIDKLEELKELVSSGAVDPNYYADVEQEMKTLESIISETYRPARKTHGHPTKAQVAQTRGVPTSEVETTGAGKAVDIHKNRPLMTPAIWANIYGGGTKKATPTLEQKQFKLEELKKRRANLEKFAGTLEKWYKQRGFIGEAGDTGFIITKELEKAANRLDEMISAKLARNVEDVFEELPAAAHQFGLNIEKFKISADQEGITHYPLNINPRRFPGPKAQWISPDGKHAFIADRYDHLDTMALMLSGQKYHGEPSPERRAAIQKSVADTMRLGFIRQMNDHIFEAYEPDSSTLHIVEAELKRAISERRISQKDVGVIMVDFHKVPGVTGKVAAIVNVNDFAENPDLNYWLGRNVREARVRQSNREVQRGISLKTPLAGMAAGGVIGGAVAGIPGLAAGMGIGFLAPVAVAQARVLAKRFPSQINFFSGYDAKLAKFAKSGRYIEDQKPKDLGWIARYMGSVSTWYTNPRAHKSIPAEAREAARILVETDKAIEKMGYETKRDWVRSVKPISEAEWQGPVVDALEGKVQPTSLTPKQKDAFDMSRLILDEQRTGMRDALRFALTEDGFSAERASELVPDEWGISENYFPHVFEGRWSVLQKVGKEWEPVETGWRQVTKREARKVASDYLEKNPGANIRTTNDQRHNLSNFRTAERRLYQLTKDIRAVAKDFGDPNFASELDALSKKASAIAFGPEMSARRFFGHAQKRESNTPGWARDRASFEQYLMAANRYIHLVRARPQLMKLRNALAERLEESSADAPARLPKRTGYKILGRLDRAIEGLEGYPTAFESALRAGFERAGLEPRIAEKGLALATEIQAMLKLGFSPAAAVWNLTQVPINGFSAKELGPRGITLGIEGLLTNYGFYKGSVLEALDIRPKFAKMDVEDFQSYSKAYTYAKNASLWMFSEAEYVNQAVTAIGAYRKAVKEGARHTEALDIAQRANLRINFSYSKFDKPPLLRALPAPVAQFKTFSFKQMEFVTGLRGAGEWGRFLLAMLGMGILSLPFVETIDDAIEAATGESPLGWIRSKNGVLEKLIHGLPGLAGIDATRNVAFTEAFRPTFRNMAGPLFTDIGTFMQAAPQLSHYLIDYPPGSRQHEAALQQFLRGLSPTGRRLWETATDPQVSKDPRTGNPILQDITPMERLLLSMGFTPIRVAHEQDLNREADRLRARRTDNRGFIVDTLARTIVDLAERDLSPAQTEARYREFDKYMQSAIDQGYVNDLSQSVKNRIKATMLDRWQRELLRTPRDIRLDILQLYLDAEGAGGTELEP